MKKPMRVPETVKLRFSKSQFLKLFISLWLVFHLAIMIVMPNSGSYLGRHFENLFVSYANALNLNTPWNFFSPDPAHTMYFRYTIYFKNDFLEDIKDPVEGYFPEGKEDAPQTSSGRRELYAMRYMILEPSRVDKFLGPWLCKQYEGATHIKLEHIVDTIPPLDRAVFDKKIKVSEMGEKIEIINRDYNCKGQNDELSS